MFVFRIYHINIMIFSWKHALAPKKHDTLVTPDQRTLPAGYETSAVHAASKGHLPATRRQNSQGLSGYPICFK